MIKPRHLLKLVAGVLCPSFLMVPGGAAGADTLPTDPNDIRPLLVGSSVPDARVRDVQGETHTLPEIMDGTPTVLIVYRGGW